jgi:hypothetical protein
MLVQAIDFPKNFRSVNMTSVSWSNNYGVPMLMAMLGEKSGTWLQCLQNSGEFLPHPVCKHKRPVSVQKKGKDRREKFWSYNFASKEASVKDGPLLVKPLPLTRDSGAQASPSPLNPLIAARQMCLFGGSLQGL